MGTVGKTFGVHGWMKLHSYSGEWGHFAALDSAVLRRPKEHRRTEYRIEGFRMHRGRGLFKFRGIDTPEEGKRLSGSEILVPREYGAPLKKDEWYLDDLVGLEVRGECGTLHGEVVGLIEAADDLLEVRRPDGTCFFIPFRSRFVSEPDTERGKLTLKADWLAE